MFGVMKKVIHWLLTPVDGGKINWYVNGLAIGMLIALLIGLLTP